jgi:hypothetical protein
LAVAQSGRQVEPSSGQLLARPVRGQPLVAQSGQQVEPWQETSSNVKSKTNTSSNVRSTKTSKSLNANGAKLNASDMMNTIGIKFRTHSRSQAEDLSCRSTGG